VHQRSCSCAEGWQPRLQLVLTTKDQASAAKDALPVSYERLPSMVEVGDEIFLGRYLVTGAEEASLFLEVNTLAPSRLVRSDMACAKQPAATAAAGCRLAARSRGEHGSAEGAAFATASAAGEASDQ
jgi:hypothetical protein